ncbi:MAG: hypothetical protein FE835_18260 [Gammaproteobacteria bacterium]|nr:hypothetical protein [Gammaproteobacteria bacterium]
MIVDVVTDKGVSWMRYNTDCPPHVDETISTLKPEKKEFQVLSISHLIGPKHLSDEMRQEFITVTVQEK